MATKTWVAPATLKVGDAVTLEGYSCSGVVKYVGNLAFKGPRVGVELAVAHKHACLQGWEKTQSPTMDGVVKDQQRGTERRYFRCRAGHGIMVAPSAVKLVAAANANDDDDDEGDDDEGKAVKFKLPSVERLPKPASTTPTRPSDLSFPDGGTPPAPNHTSSSAIQADTGLSRRSPLSEGTAASKVSAEHPVAVASAASSAAPSPPPQASSVVSEAACVGALAVLATPVPAPAKIGRFGVSRLPSTPISQDVTNGAAAAAIDPSNVAFGPPPVSAASPLDSNQETSDTAPTKSGRFNVRRIPSTPKTSQSLVSGGDTVAAAIPASAHLELASTTTTLPPPSREEVDALIVDLADQPGAVVVPAPTLPSPPIEADAGVGSSFLINIVDGDALGPATAPTNVVGPPAKAGQPIAVATLPITPSPAPGKKNHRFAVVPVPKTPMDAATARVTPPAGRSRTTSESNTSGRLNPSHSTDPPGSKKKAIRKLFEDEIEKLLHAHEIERGFRHMNPLVSTLAAQFDKVEQLVMLTSAQATELDMLLKEKQVGIRARAVVSQLCQPKVPWSKKISKVVRQGFVDHFKNRLQGVFDDLGVKANQITWDDNDVPGTFKRSLQANFTVKFADKEKNLELNATAVRLSQLNKEFTSFKQHVFPLLMGSIDTELTIKQVETSYEQANLENEGTVKFRLSYAEINTKIRLNANMNFDYIVFTFAAAVIAAVGLGRDDVVSTVASMLISPIMGPIMGVTFGGVANDSRLILESLRNELVGLGICLVVGFVTGLLMANWAPDWDWPTAAMESRGEPIALLVGLAIAIPSGLGVALSITAANTSGLVGVAISASLLPPAVNAGMCWGLAVLAPPSMDASALVATGGFSLMLTLVNIVTIIVVATSAFHFRTILPSKNEDVADFNKTIAATRHKNKNDKGEGTVLQEQLKDSRKTIFQKTVQKTTVGFRRFCVWFRRFLGRKKPERAPAEAKGGSTNVNTSGFFQRFVPPIRLVFHGVRIGDITDDKADKTDRGALKRKSKVDGKLSDLSSFASSDDPDHDTDAAAKEKAKQEAKAKDIEEQQKAKRLATERAAILAKVNACAKKINEEMKLNAKFELDEVQIEVTTCAKTDSASSGGLEVPTFARAASMSDDLTMEKVDEQTRIVDQNVLINPKDNSITLEYMQKLEKALLRQQHANDDGTPWPYAGITPNIQLVKDSRREEAAAEEIPKQDFKSSTKLTSLFRSKSPKRMTLSRRVSSPPPPLGSPTAGRRRIIGNAGAGAGQTSET